MKRYKTGKWRSALSLAMVTLALALSSCTKEPLLPGEQQDKESMNVSLELISPGAYTSVQSRVDVDDNGILRADVLLFKNNILIRHTTGSITDVDGARSKMQIYVTPSQSESDLFDIMVICNAPIKDHNQTKFDFDSYVNKTKDELKADFNILLPYGWWLDKRFVMYGEVLQTLIKPTTNNVKINLIRSVARVDIGLGAYDEATDSWAGLGSFDLDEVLVVNFRDKSAVIPSATTFNSTGNVKVDAPTIPSGTAVKGTTAATALKYTIMNEHRYTKSYIFLAEAPNTTDRVTLLLGIRDRNYSQKSYYRVDFVVPKAGEPGSYDYLNLLRNHLYRITVTDISGVGLTDPQEALLSAPSNIRYTLTPIEEGGMGGDIIFDDNNYLMTDVSNVLIYGKPDGVKRYPIVTVKATFAAGVVATISGLGFGTTPGYGTVNLVSGVSQTISAVIPAGATSYYCQIEIGGWLSKLIECKVQPPVDAHFDFLPFQDVASITIPEPQPWITLSNNRTYVKGEQQSAYITGNANGKAVVHFDENIATTGNPRIARALITRNNGTGTTGVVFDQLDLSGMVLGYFGGAMGDNGYTKLLGMESTIESAERIYDDTPIDVPLYGGLIQWGFSGLFLGVTSIDLGRAATFALAKTRFAENGVVATEADLSIYNNYAARSCFDKNRDENGDGTIDESEVHWYLPAQNQLMGVWVSYVGLPPLDNWGMYFCSSTEVLDDVVYLSIEDGSMHRSGKGPYSVRCVRDL